MGALKPLLVLVAALAALVLPGQASAAGQCGLPSAGTWWIDFGTPELRVPFLRPGVILAASTGDFPAEARQAGAKTVFWDMNLNNRVGTTVAPADPALIVERANRLFDFAAAQSACEKPIVALNELLGSSLPTPWSVTNAQYRDNVLVFLRVLHERGARPFLLLSSEPHTAGDAADWWREAARYADLVPETYFSAPTLHRQGAVVANRRLRTTMRRSLSKLLAIGIPSSKLGLVLGFQTGRGKGGREGLSPREAWFEVVKWQALAGREVARDLDIASVWSWGWQTYAPNPKDPDAPAAGCVYLWTRNPALCDGPGAAGPRFNASRTDGQLRVPAGAQCAFGPRRISSGDLAALTRLTGDRDVAFTLLLARAAESRHAPTRQARVLAAERAVIAHRFGGSRAAYRAAVARAGATVAIARTALADELRRAELSQTMRARATSPAESATFYRSYPDLLTRAFTADPTPWWLGGRATGLALEGFSPEPLFGLRGTQERTFRWLDGAYEVTPLGEAQRLGSVPLGQARPAIAAALRSFARRAAFERWSLARQTELLRLAVCRRDEYPAAGTVRAASYLPFLSLTASG